MRVRMLVAEEVFRRFLGYARILNTWLLTLDRHMSELHTLKYVFIHFGGLVQFRSIGF